MKQPSRKNLKSDSEKPIAQTYPKKRQTNQNSKAETGGFVPKKRASFGKGNPKPEVRTTPGINKKDGVRLNRFISLSGVCSRRDADDHILAGKITVNGEVVTTLGSKVIPGKDIVKFMGKPITPEKKVYILMNKPKNHITTADDPEGRRTVMDILKHATHERVFPVGRLDRNTTGLLLFTNDGDLAEKLTHPSHQVRKVYHVKLERCVLEEDLERLRKGIELEDGIAVADKISYVANKDCNEIGVEIHSGKNRVVRRMFESLGYEVKYLDRVIFGPLTKKDLPRGKFRFLSDKEVAFLRISG